MTIEERVPARVDGGVAPGELHDRAADLFPGGVNSPVRAYRAVGGQPPEIVAGEGPLVRDAEGRTYVDLVGAYGPLILGHADRRVATAIATAALDGGPFGVTTAAEVRLGQAIKAAMPSIERLRFTTSGTEAVMSALRVARAAAGRELVLKFDGGYHGHSDGLLAEAGSGLATLGLPGSAGVTRAVAAETLVAPYNDLAAVRAIVAEHRDRIAAIVVEPVAANMGVVAPARGFLEGLRALTAREGIVLVFDEVITGFRVAHGGAQARYGVRPDLTVLGKIIGGGLPIGAYGGRADLMDLVAPAGPVYQAGTLAGHPLTMAAGAATLEALDDDLYAELERLGGSLAAALAAAADEAGVPVAIGRVGSLLTVFFRAGLPVDHATARDSDTAAFARFHRAARLAGIHAPPSQFEAWFLSAAHTDGELARIVEAARIGFAAAAAP